MIIINWRPLHFGCKRSVTKFCPKHFLSQFPFEVSQNVFWVYSWYKLVVIVVCSAFWAQVIITAIIGV